VAVGELSAHEPVKRETVVPINSYQRIMTMTKTEQQVLRNIIARLNRPNCGCYNSDSVAGTVAIANDHGVECVARIYLDTWIIPALEYLLPGNDPGNPLNKVRDPDLARRLSR